MTGRTVFFYISGHGFGHAVRQIEIINAFGDSMPADVRIAVRSGAPRWLFARSAHVPLEWLPGPTDTGIVQIDSLRLDESATVDAAAAFYDSLPPRIESERMVLERYGASLVVSDAPPLACAAARAAGVPAVVCGNFTWDWIYQEYIPRTSPGFRVIETIQALYRNASAAWRLPMHGGFETFPEIVDLPFVARHSRHGLDRQGLRRQLNLPQDVRLALVSFGGYGVRDLPLHRLDCTDGWRVIVAGRAEDIEELPRGVHGVAEGAVYERGLRYEDLVRACDVVVTKPGYGIISDCIANGTALLYTSRGRFPEYDVLVREMPRFLRCRFISLEDFLACRWSDALESVAAMPPPPETADTRGAAVAARMIAAALEQGVGGMP